MTLGSRRRHCKDQDESEQGCLGLFRRTGHFGYSALAYRRVRLPGIAFCADLGQGEDLQAIRRKAIKTGASKAVVGDLREEFVKEYVFPMLRANAVYEGSYLLGTSIARPLIAKAQIDAATRERADAVSHGATGGNDQVRFELTYYALKPGIKVIAPWRLWNLHSRTSLIAYARKRGPGAGDQSAALQHRSQYLSHQLRRRHLGRPWKSPAADMFVWCRPVEKAPNRAEYVEIDYRRGDPVAVNGRRLSPAKLLAKLNDLGARHGIGRVDVVENRYVGMKSRGVYETPGERSLRGAPRAGVDHHGPRVLPAQGCAGPRYAEMIYYGYWFAPEREVLQKTIDAAQANVSGRFVSSFIKVTSSSPAQVGIIALRSQGGDFRGRRCL